MANTSRPGAGCFADNFDPFADENSTLNDANGSILLSNHPELQSKRYLVSLETKLQMLKGQSPSSSNNRNSKDMLKILHQAKEDAVQHLMANDSPVGTDCIVDSQDDVQVNDVKRRMFPEQPLNTEEMQCLTERDYLSRHLQILQQDDKQISPDSPMSET